MKHTDITPFGQRSLPMKSMVQGGYETTASALSFTIYNLAANPDKAAKLMQVSPPPTQCPASQMTISVIKGQWSSLSSGSDAQMRLSVLTDGVHRFAKWFSNGNAACRRLTNLAGRRSLEGWTLRCSPTSRPASRQALSTPLTASHAAVLSPLCRPVELVSCATQGHAREHTSVTSWREPSSRQNLRAFGRRFCQLAELLAESLPHCYLSRKSRQSASLYELQFCRGLRSM